MLNGAASRAAVAVCLVLVTSSCGTKQPITVGAKDSTEQRILGEIIAQHLEQRLGHPVARDFGAASTMLAYQNLLIGAIDLYPEYTSDILQVILQRAGDKDPAVVFERARSEIRRTAGMDLLDPLGFDHSFAIIATGTAATRRGLEKISDLERSNQGWTLGVTPDFQERRDGYTALVNAYDIVWKAPPRIVDDGAVYELLSDNSVDLVVGRRSDGQLAGSDVVMLEDDRQAFVPSQACILVKKGVLDKTRGLRAALVELSGKFTVKAMRQMNYDVDVRAESVSEVAREFLKSVGL
jgi:osmoprotectant transport system substrate-binding protein